MTPLSMSNDRVLYSQSDMDDSNFGVDREGRTVVLDFESIGLLPETLILCTLSRDHNLREVLPSLLATVGLSGETSLEWLAAIRSCLWMTADPTLGESKSTGWVWCINTD